MTKTKITLKHLLDRGFRKMNKDENLSEHALLRDGFPTTVGMLISQTVEGLKETLPNIVVPKEDLDRYLVSVPPVEPPKFYEITVNDNFIFLEDLDNYLAIPAEKLNHEKNEGISFLQVKRGRIGFSSPQAYFDLLTHKSDEQNQTK